MKSSVNFTQVSHFNFTQHLFLLDSSHLISVDDLTSLYHDESQTLLFILRAKSIL